jgi:hypothetical protein
MENINQMMVILLINLFCTAIYAQVSTPNGTSVDYQTGTYNAANAATAESQAANWLSARGWTNSVIKTAPATGEYNCHSYAWYRSEGGTGNYWMNAFLNSDMNNFNPYSYNSTPPAPNNIKKYWNDGSYAEVPESEATKVWYGSYWTWNSYNGWENSYDHSAVRITSGTHAGKYESKWGAWPRYIHPADKSPYNTSNRRYYKKAPTISGPTLVLNAGSTYTLNGNSGSSVTWTYSSNLQKPSSSNTSITVKPLSATSNGLGWIQASVGGISTLRYEVWVGKPVITGINGSPLQGLFRAGYDTKAAIPANGFLWVLTPQNDLSMIMGNTSPVNITFFNDGLYTLSVRATNANGTGAFYDMEIYVSPYSPSPSPASYRAYLNPASDEIGRAHV